MANLTERNGLVLSCEPSLNAHFHFRFFFSLLRFCFVLFCCSFNFPSWYQFIFVPFNCWKFNFTYFSHNYDNYSMFRDVPECSGMFRNIPCSGIFHVPEYSMFQVLSTPLNRCKYTNFASFFAKFCFYPWITVFFILFILVFTCCWRHH